MLDGLRVLDLSRVIAGPYCATLMADLGADVVKVERPGRGDDLRAWRGDGMSATFAAINRNKRGIAVDMQQAEGARLVLELARRADVVVENFLPGVADKLGVGYAAVSAVNPPVIYVSVTGFGQTGPHAKRAGYNTIAQGVSGIMALTGMPGGPPTKVGGSVADLAAGFLAFGVANAALVRWTESLADELKREGITANAVLPRIIDTPENRAAMPKGDPRAWATPDEIASLILFLSTDEASGVTAAAIPVVART